MSNGTLRATPNSTAEQVIHSVSSIPALEESEEKKPKQLVAKEFFWDDWFSYVASALVALSLIDLSIEFLAGSNLSVLCFTPFPNSTVLFPFEYYNRDQSAFVNSWCSRLLPYTQYYTLLVVIQGVLIYIPHYIWASIHASSFEFYFSFVGTLERLRKPEIGKYCRRNTSVVHRLKERYGERSEIFLTYILKLIVQLIFTVFFLVISILYFKDFRTIFLCPSDKNEPSPFDQVECVYSRFQFVEVLRYVDISVLSLGCMVLMIALILVAVRASSLNRNHRDLVANFSYHSGLKPNYFVPGKIICPIFHDIDFLLLKLLYTDEGFGKLLQDIQIEEEAGLLFEADIQSLSIYTYICVNEAPESREKDKKEDLIRLLGNSLTTVENFIHFVSKKIAKDVPFRNCNDKPGHAAIDISFSPHAYSFVMSRHFSRVCSIYLDNNFYNPEKVVDIENYPDFQVAHVPENILALPGSSKLELIDFFKNQFLDYNSSKSTTVFKIGLIVVNGIDSDSKMATVSEIIEILSDSPDGFILEDAILMVLQPYKIESKKMGAFANRSFRYLSERYWKKSELKDFISVSSGDIWMENTVSLTCGSSKCVFKCDMQKYKPDQYTSF